MSAQDFIAGPVHIDGQELFFFVELKKADAGRGLLAAAYTAVIMADKKEELIFSAYENRRTRMTEDDWYRVAQEQYQCHLHAVCADAEVLESVRKVVEKCYFKEKTPAELHAILDFASIKEVANAA